LDAEDLIDAVYKFCIDRHGNEIEAEHLICKEIDTDTNYEVYIYPETLGASLFAAVGIIPRHISIGYHIKYFRLERDLYA
jgi:hypothetical protein